MAQQFRDANCAWHIRLVKTSYSLIKFCVGFVWRVAFTIKRYIASMLIEILFVLALFGIVYSYLGYPILLLTLKSFSSVNAPSLQQRNVRSVSLIIPVHNEESVIETKINNIKELDYPEDKIQIIMVSDGSTDNTNTIIETLMSSLNIDFIKIEKQRGKANALNKGLEHATGEILVFSDASIILDKNIIRELVSKFNDSTVGCVSGEDHIAGASGEGLYGKYELLVRNLESQVISIVGASGSIYAQRRDLCSSFIEGLAPDFLSVLNTAEKGFRSVTAPKAFGSMTAAKDTGNEFQRKVRTLLRGITTLVYKRNLLNPFRYGAFSFVLISHKLVRWMVPFLLIVLIITSGLLYESDVIAIFFLLQIVFYAVAFLAWKNIVGFGRSTLGKIPLFFTLSNMAIFKAWLLYFKGVRQEVWKPTKRD